MSWGLLLYVAAGLLAGFLGWGVWLLRQNVGGSLQRLALVELSDIPALAEECRRTVRAELKTDLDPRDPDAAARALDELVLAGRLRALFKTPGYELRYAEPVGAFLGELIRRHTGAEWMDDVLGPRLVIHRPAGIKELHPFTLAVRHHTHGRPGQLHACVMDAIGRA
ncbi:MAG TPA: hypothetical protein VE871_11790 [Longimicrobium sp.]|nr:hypothetical protein [Longimicrobium sp.]